MTHPIVALQGVLTAAWRADPELVALIGADAVLDARPKGRTAPHAVIVRHDALARDGDITPGWEQRLLVHAWADGPSRRSALVIVERIVAVALGADLDGADLIVTGRIHERTDTAIDAATGHARAAVTLRFFTEPA